MEKAPSDPELRRKIEELIAYKGGGFNEQNVADIVENALKLLADVRHSGDVRVIQTALRELRYAFKLFAPYANVRKVTIFGSARTLPTRIEYQQALDRVLDDMIDRCAELKLRAVGPDRELIMNFTVLLTANTVHSLHSPSRREWYAL